MTPDTCNSLTDCPKCRVGRGRTVLWEAGVRSFLVNGRVHREPSGSWALIECASCKHTWKVLYGALAAA